MFFFFEPLIKRIPAPDNKNFIEYLDNLDKNLINSYSNINNMLLENNKKISKKFLEEVRFFLETLLQFDVENNPLFSVYGPYFQIGLDKKKELRAAFSVMPRRTIKRVILTLNFMLPIMNKDIDNADYINELSSFITTLHSYFLFKKDHPFEEIYDEHKDFNLTLNRLVLYVINNDDMFFDKSNIIDSLELLTNAIVTTKKKNIFSIYRQIYNCFINAIISQSTDNKDFDLKKLSDVIPKNLLNYLLFDTIDFKDRNLLKKNYYKATKLVKSYYKQNVVRRNDMFMINQTENIERIYVNIMKGEKICEDIKNIICSLQETLDELARSNDNFLYEQKENFKKIFSNLDNSEDKLESELSKFNVTIADKLVKNVSEEAPNFLNDKIKSLENIIGENSFSKLSFDSKRWIATAYISYETLNKLNEPKLDYSGVCLLLVKALENECQNRFYFSFIKYMENKKYDLHKYPASYKVKKCGKEQLKEPNNFVLGNIAYTLKYPNCTLIDYCSNELFTNKDKKYIEEFLIKLGEKISYVTQTFRNPSAHTGTMNKISAENCFDYILVVQRLLEEMLEEFMF